MLGEIVILINAVVISIFLSGCGTLQNNQSDSLSSENYSSVLKPTPQIDETFPSTEDANKPLDAVTLLQTFKNEFPESIILDYLIVDLNKDNLNDLIVTYFEVTDNSIISCNNITFWVQDAVCSGFALGDSNSTQIVKGSLLVNNLGNVGLEIYDRTQNKSFAYTLSYELKEKDVLIKVLTCEEFTK